MEWFTGAITWVASHTVQFAAVGWAIEKLLEVVSVLTPWKWDDNLGVLLAKILQKFAPTPKA